jgi:hypothetical protein
MRVKQSVLIAGVEIASTPGGSRNDNDRTRDGYADPCGLAVSGMTLAFLENAITR